MSRRVSAACLVLAWLCAQGALTESVQVLAWARMFSGYARTMTWKAAITETLDPTKPCEICSAVQKVREAGRPSADAPLPARDAAKLVLAPISLDEELVPPDLPSATAADDLRPGEWQAAVPTPPPRGARA